MKKVGKCYISKEYRNTPVEEAFLTLDRIFALNDNLVSVDDQSDVLKVKIEDKFFYIKRFYRHGSFLRRHIIRSRCTTEFENLKFVGSLGIPTPKIVAYKQSSLFWRLGKGKGVLISEEVTHAKNLYEISKTEPEKFSNSHWRIHLIKELANDLSLLHAKRFVHCDLNWRNLLIKEQDGKTEIYFFDMPLARRRFDFSFRHFMMKDLAMLDRYACQILRRSDRLRFFLYYLGRASLTKRDKQLAKRIRRYNSKKNKIKI